MMARIRTIKPDFFTSEQIVECSTNARLLFIGLWCFSDDAGRHPASPKRLRMEVFPGDVCPVQDVDAMIEELLATGLILEYESQSQRYWQVTGWDKHQKIDRPNPRFPSPFDEGSTILRRPIDDQSLPEGKGREGKGKEVSLASRPETEKPSNKTRRFVPPSPQEVGDYCAQRRNGISAHGFCDFYAARNWKLSRGVPMTDWKAAVRTWEKNARDRNAQQPAQTSKPWNFTEVPPCPPKSPTRKSSDCEPNSTPPAGETPSAKPAPEPPADIEIPY